MARLPKRAVELEDIIASEMLGDDADVVALILKIHLALEAILIEMIDIVRLPTEKVPPNFPAKTDYLAKRQMLPERHRQAFELFNDIRNDAAHIFAHRITLRSALKLAHELEALGIDFSDSVGSYSEAEVSEYYGGTAGVIAESGWCLLCEAAFYLREQGGRDIFSDQR